VLAADPDLEMDIHYNYQGSYYGNIFTTNARYANTSVKGQQVMLQLPPILVESIYEDAYSA
jgi:hypothetical protein